MFERQILPAIEMQSKLASNEVMNTARSAVVYLCLILFKLK